MVVKLGLIDAVRSQKIYGVNDRARAAYRNLRSIGIPVRDARLMVIGACVTLHASLYDMPQAPRNKEWVCRAAPDTRYGGK